ncbi:MAG: autotransporter-associated beta strand repeat-containing protein, partial [Armatimonadota bacterium]|nr:autotransporter-associated beta strand repeat-containing protein [Armatimonadota bacterium]
MFRPIPKRAVFSPACLSLFLAPLVFRRAALANRFLPGALAVVALFALGSGSVSASNTFTGTGTTNLLSNAANWSDGVAPTGGSQNGVTLDFNVTTGTQTSLNDDLSGNPLAFIFDSGSRALTFTTIGANQFVGVGNVFTNNSSNLQTISAGIQLFGSTSDLNAASGALSFNAIAVRNDLSSNVNIVLDGASNGTVNGAITKGTGNSSLTKQGAGTWTLKGINTYTGATAVNGGVLNLARTTSLVIVGSSNVSVSSGATLQITDHAGGGQQ